MTNTPLNPDAVEHTIKEVYGDGPRMDWPSDMTGYHTHRDYARSIVEQVVSAYLAVAQPEVNSVEELDALPDGSIVKDSEGEVYIMTPYDEFWRVWGNDKRFSSGEIVLPATVLHRP